MSVCTNSTVSGRKKGTQKLPCGFKSYSPTRTCIVSIQLRLGYQARRTCNEDVYILESKVHQATINLVVVLNEIDMTQSASIRPSVAWQVKSHLSPEGWVGGAGGIPCMEVSHGRSQYIMIILNNSNLKQHPVDSMGDPHPESPHDRVKILYKAALSHD